MLREALELLTVSEFSDNPDHDKDVEDVEVPSSIPTTPFDRQHMIERLRFYMMRASDFSEESFKYLNSTKDSIQRHFASQKSKTSDWIFYYNMCACIEATI